MSRSVRAETTLTNKAIAARLHLGTPKTANIRPHVLAKKRKEMEIVTV